MMLKLTFNMIYYSVYGSEQCYMSMNQTLRERVKGQWSEYEIRACGLN